ncbi:MAG: c-type cytochrome [Acidobacteria bacterium]|nr:c-type cytochrome [Acidobacteriota bacterium]
MKYIKVGLIAVFAALFIFACSKPAATNTPAANSGSNTNNATNAANKPAANAPTSAANDNAANTAPADEFASVRKIFKDECAKCHKEDGKGGETTVDGKKLKVPDFTSDKEKEVYDEADFIEVVTNGAGTKMPAFDKKISEADIKNLVKMIHKDFQSK